MIPDQVEESMVPDHEERPVVTCCDQSEYMCMCLCVTFAVIVFLKASLKNHKSPKFLLSTKTSTIEASVKGTPSQGGADCSYFYFPLSVLYLRCSTVTQY